MELHVPDIYGDIKLAGSSGTAGQRLTSAVPGAQAVWATDSAAIGIFEFTSASALSHVIVHNLNSDRPQVEIYNQADNAVIQPATVVATDVNTTTITFFCSKSNSWNNYRYIMLRHK